jgi:hypothetical protein
MKKHIRPSSNNSGQFALCKREAEPYFFGSFTLSYKALYNISKAIKRIKTKLNDTEKQCNCTADPDFIVS